MGTGYTRNDGVNNIANGNVIDAADLDGEFDAIVAAFVNTTGHTHDGTAAEGAPITVFGPTQEYLGDATAIYPKVDATYDLGKTSASFNVGYVESLNLGGTLVTSTAAELNILDGVTSTAVELNILDGVTSTTAELNVLDGIPGTLTATELGYVDGVTSAIQTQLNNKQALDTGLTSIAGLTTAADTMIYTTLSDTYATTPLTAAGRALLDDASASAQRTTLGLGTAATTASTAYATAAQGTTADAALPRAGGTMTGNITMPALGTVDGRDVSVDGAKLDGIEALADVTDTTNVTAAGALMDSELTNIGAIKALNQGVATTNTPTFAGIITTGNVDGRDVSVDGAKLDGIEALADKTDTANVTAAGALMDSELTNITAIKALNQGVATTNTPTFAGIITAGNVDGRDVSVDGAKLDGIAAGATANVGDITGVTAGGGISGGGTSGTVTISHTDTSAQGSVNNSGSTFIQDITLDTYGHVTAIGSAAISFPAPTSAQVGSATAGLSTGAVGTYAFLRADNTATVTPAGTTVAGSTMRYGDINFSKSGTPAGTWRCMGYAATRNYATVYMRIS